MPVDTSAQPASSRRSPSRPRSVRTLEKKMWGRVFDDGLFDLFLGALFVNVAAFMLAGELGQSQGAAIYFVVLLAIYQLYAVAKRRITVPRLGHFKPAQKHRRRFGTVGAVSVGVSIVMLLATVLAVTGVFSDGVPLLLILFSVLAVKMVALFSLAAYYLGVLRFYVYAALGAAGMAGAEIAVATGDAGRGWDVVAMFAVPAFAMVPTGVVLLTRFVRAYPLHEVNESA